MYLKDFKKVDFKDVLIKKDTRDKESNEQKISSNIKTVDQIKNIFQQDKPTPKIKSQDVTNELIIGSFEDLIDLCNKKKEIKLKYELENNVNLVTFAAGRIEIAFNENLDKDFIKDLSNKLYEWTYKRWIISLSKKEGAISKKQEKQINKNKIFEDAKKSTIYKKVLETFSDAELIDVKLNKDRKDD